MRNNALAIIFSLSSVIGIGQDFRITPSNTMDILAPNNQPIRTEIFFENVSNTTITLHWELISNDLISGWDSYICDDATNFQGIPQKGTISNINPGIRKYLSLYVDPKAIPGDGMLQLSIYEEGDSINKDTLTWIVHSSSGLGINELGWNTNIKVFPNPASDYITVDMSTYPSGMANTLSIYNSAGQEIMKKSVANNATLEKLNVTDLPKGNYMLMIKGNAHKQLSKTFVKQ